MLSASGAKYYYFSPKLFKNNYFERSLMSQIQVLFLSIQLLLASFSPFKYKYSPQMPMIQVGRQFQTFACCPSILCISQFYVLKTFPNDSPLSNSIHIIFTSVKPWPKMNKITKCLFLEFIFYYSSFQILLYKGLWKLISF